MHPNSNNKGPCRDRSLLKKGGEIRTFSKSRNLLDGCNCLYNIGRQYMNGKQSLILRFDEMYGEWSRLRSKSRGNSRGKIHSLCRLRL